MNGFLFIDLGETGFYGLISKLTDGPSHCGIVNGDKVIHSMPGGVQLWTLDEFLGMNRGAYSLYSTGDEDFDDFSFEIARRFIGLPYDFSFNLLDDNTQYCSKLIYDVLKYLRYDSLCSPVKIKDMPNVDNYKEQFLEFYGDEKSFPLDNFCVTPRMIQQCLVKICQKSTCNV